MVGGNVENLLFFGLFAGEELQLQNNQNLVGFFYLFENVCFQTVIEICVCVCVCVETVLGMRVLKL